MNSTRRLGALCVAGLFAHSASGQGATASNTQRPTTAAGTAPASSTSAGAPTPPIAAPIGDPLANLRLVPIDPGTEDVSPLWEGGRQMPVDLRKPLNFEQVYRVEGDLSRLGVLGISPAPGQSMYARASGGLIAVFPQSEYVPTRQGAFPIVPANTTFLLGSAQTLTELASPMERSPLVTAASAAQRVDLRAVSQRTPPDANPPAAPKREPMSIWNSEVARRSRLAALLDEAKPTQSQAADKANAERVADSGEPDATGQTPAQAAEPEPTPASDP